MEKSTGVASISTIKQSLAIGIVVMITSKAKINVHIGSANVYSGLKYMMIEAIITPIL
jgi:hypothetical protein